MSIIILTLSAAVMWFVLFLPSAFASEIWLVYSKPDTRPATYLGYKNTTPPNSFDDVDSTEKPTINDVEG